MTEDEISDAVLFAQSRGWKASFGPAVKLESGRSSCGVAVLVKDGQDFGVSALADYDYDGWGHRLQGVILEVPGWGRHIACSVYLAVSEGLSEGNLKLLAKAAAIQEKFSLPLVLGGDFNFAPSKLASLDFPARKSASRSSLGPNL